MKIRNKKMSPISIVTLTRNLSIGGNATIEIGDDELSGDILSKERNGIIEVFRNPVVSVPSISMKAEDSKKPLTKEVDVVQTNIVHDVNKEDPIAVSHVEVSRKKRSGGKHSRQGGKQ